MKVLAIIGQKGGAGKTTTSLGLAVQAGIEGLKVRIVDLDPQATALNWSDRRSSELPSVLSSPVSRLTQALATADKDGFDLVVIDTPGKSTEAMIAASKVAHFVVMPIQPQLFDIETTANAKEVLMLAGNPPAAAVVNRAPTQGRRHIETQEAIAAQGLTVSPVVLYARAAHGDAGNIGQTATEYEPKGKAAEEMAALYSYIAIALQGDDGHNGTNGDKNHEAKPTRRRS
jgi:chromosome partitioning protein